MGYEDLGAPQSRNERYLMNMLGATYETGEPQSRIEYLLKEILENGGGGSGEVTGVKGAVEAAYRKGQVNLTIEDITNLIGGLSYDSSTKELHGTQYDDMPTPSSFFEDKIIQFSGATDANYKSGHFYKCVNNAGVYSWIDISGDTTESLTPQQLNALLALLD